MGCKLQFLDNQNNTINEFSTVLPAGIKRKNYYIKIETPNSVIDTEIIDNLISRAENSQCPVSIEAGSTGLLVRNNHSTNSVDIETVETTKNLKQGDSLEIKEGLLICGNSKIRVEKV